jgi:hypothetical protein
MFFLEKYLLSLAKAIKVFFGKIFVAISSFVFEQNKINVTPKFGFILVVSYDTMAIFVKPSR